eukprot:GFKZ01013887.1.p1 GENE.GFKZ01013887.1~~GFKZ01013887.1.p1  ORF type:complete len:274 (+),score=24.44 GFKZ01013887.1:86-907(+)
MAEYNSRHIVPSPSPDYSPQLLSPSPFTFISPQYNAATTVAINLRQFERDSKAQAESEYDAEHGPLPEPPAEDDHSIPEHERNAQKKKRKVRSAIVSRRKTAIYVEKLEAALEARDNNNASLASQLGVCREVLRETSSRIEKLKRTLHARQDPAQKRLRTTPVPRPGPSTEAPGFFLDHNETFDDLLSISPEEISPVTSYSKGDSHGGVRAVHNTDSECSDGQLSPKQMAYPSSARGFSGFSIRDDSGYRSRAVGLHSGSALQNHHFRTPVAM